MLCKEYRQGWVTIGSVDVIVTLKPWAMGYSLFMLQHFGMMNQKTLPLAQHGIYNPSRQPRRVACEFETCLDYSVSLSLWGWEWSLSHLKQVQGRTNGHSGCHSGLPSPATLGDSRSGVENNRKSIGVNQ